MNIFNESPHFTALLKLQFKQRPKRMHKNAPSTSLKALQMAVQKKEKDSSFRFISCKEKNGHLIIINKSSLFLIIDVEFISEILLLGKCLESYLLKQKAF